VSRHPLVHLSLAHQLTFGLLCSSSSLTTAVIYGTVELKNGRSFNSFEVGSTPSDNKVLNALVIFMSVFDHLP
jgi:hypothetical protein